MSNPNAKLEMLSFVLGILSTFVTLHGLTFRTFMTSCYRLPHIFMLVLLCNVTLILCSWPIRRELLEWCKTIINRKVIRLISYSTLLYSELARGSHRPLDLFVNEFWIEAHGFLGCQSQNSRFHVSSQWPGDGGWSEIMELYVSPPVSLALLYTLYFEDLSPSDSTPTFCLGASSR